MTDPNGRRNFSKNIRTRFKENYTKITDYLNLSPIDFSWKVRWRMKYDHNPLFIQIQDKLGVRAYAQEKGILTADVYFVTDEPETIPFGALPKTYFIKATHGCGWNILFENGTFYNWVSGVSLIERDLSKSIITQEQCMQLCHTWLGSTYSKRQWAYQYIQPLLLVEEKLEPHDGYALVVYRCFVFDGVVKVINVDSPMHKRGTDLFVDANWQPFSIPRHFEQPPNPLPQKPEKLTEIVRAAERLGEGFDFMRVDLFNANKGIVLGEMTVYPEGGTMHTPTTDQAFNKWLSEQWILPDINDPDRVLTK